MPVGVPGVRRRGLDGCGERDRLAEDRRIRRRGEARRVLFSATSTTLRPVYVVWKTNGPLTPGSGYGDERAAQWVGCGDRECLGQGRGEAVNLTDAQVAGQGCLSADGELIVLATSGTPPISIFKVPEAVWV